MLHSDLSLLYKSATKKHKIALTSNMRVNFQYEIEEWSILGVADVTLAEPADRDEYGRETECDTPESVFLIEAFLGMDKLDIDKLPATLRAKLSRAALETAHYQTELEFEAEMDHLFSRARPWADPY